MNNQRPYVDHYAPRLVYLSVITLFLSALDATLTLRLLAGGGTEINPFMAVLIERDLRLFIATKMVITAGGLLFLLVHSQFRLFGTLPVARLIDGVFWGYLSLVVYEIVLLTFFL